jgi:hypothetical protein
VSGDDFAAMFPGPFFPVTLLLFLVGLAVLGVWKAVEIVIWLVKHVSITVA